MTKKEITYRPMFGFSEKPKPKTAEEDKDETIRQLRASLELLEAREAKRKTQTRDRVRKLRGKK